MKSYKYFIKLRQQRNLIASIFLPLITGQLRSDYVYHYIIIV